MADLENNIVDMMKLLGFDHSFYIPVANEENKILEKEVEEMFKKKAELMILENALDYDIREEKNLITSLTNQEAQNQNLTLTYRQQYETETHLFRLDINDNEKRKHEKKEAEKQLKEMIQSLNKLENELTKTEELITKKRETIEWGEETLLAWNNDLAKRDMDLNLLEAYHLEDDDRFKELDLRRQQLQQQVIERESIVEKEVNELLRVERELEQTSKLNKKAHQERNRLLEQWENAVNFCTSNQNDMQNIVEEINKIREAVREIYNKKKENEQKYQDCKEDNEELEYEINEIKKANNELKRLILIKQSENENSQLEVLTAQKSLNIICNTLSNERTKRKHMQNEQAKLKTLIQKKEEDIKKIKNNIFELQNNSMTVEERMSELNKFADNLEVNAEQLVSEKNKVLIMTNSVKNEIKQLQSKIDLLTNQLDQNRTGQIMLNKEKFKLKKLIMDQKELLYNRTFEMENKNRKETEKIGEVLDLQEKLKTLNEELNRTEENQRQLENLLKSVENETRRITKDIEKNATELETTRNRVEELNIRNEGGEKEIQSLIEKNHHYHTEEMMVKFRMEQIKKLMENECKKEYTMAQQRDEITRDINQRKAELAAFYERMKEEKKILLEEMSSAKRRLDALVQHIEQRRNKYQILLATVGMTDDDTDDCEYVDDQSFFSISEHRIRVLQEKLELQDMGDTLDESVQNLESEIRSMENTLHIMSASNSCYKANLASLSPASDEYKEKIVLEETIEKLNCLWLQKKETFENTKSQIKDLEIQYKTKKEELENIINLRDIYNCDLERVLKEADEQTNRFNRLKSRIQFEKKKIDKRCGTDKQNALLLKRDIELRILRKLNKCGLEQMSEMSIRHIGVEPTVKQYLSEKDLELPTVSGLMMSNIKSSCGSSAVSLISNNSSIKSNSYEDRKSVYSVNNLEPAPRGHPRKSDASIRNKT